MDRKAPPHNVQGDSEKTSAGASVPEAAASTTDDVTIAEAMQAVETLTAIYGFSEEAASEAVHQVTTSHTQNISGSDLVALCCDFILDNGLGIDSGGAIAPIDNCPHVAFNDEDNNKKCTSNDSQTFRCVVVTAKDVPETIFDQPCQYYEECKDHFRKPTGGLKDDTEYSVQGKPTCPQGENWWCLKCGGVYCSRYVNGHGVKHYEEQQNQDNPNKEHCVMIGLADLSVWCHVCGAYLETHHNKRLSSILQRLQDIKFKDE